MNNNYDQTAVVNRTFVTLFGAVAHSVKVDDAVLTETRYAPEEFLPAHEHATPMFVLVLGGGFDERFGSNERSCDRYDLLYRPVGERHANRFWKSGAACLSIELRNASVVDALDTADGRIPLRGVPALHALRAYDEMHRRDAESCLVVDEIIARLIDAAAPRRFVVETRAPDWLERAREMVHDALPAVVRFGDVADAVGVHRVHLSRTFQKFYGCSLGDYVRRVRVHRACAALRRETSSAAAYVSGFSDESHMGRNFRGVMNCTPGNYRSAVTP
ncbi:MAG TPA: AraC family transcriptional regulator [Gemmatimonadaceae bacterium]|nr:AraC family transcriptional regulator [Gemmatimonadaceae bacterium]